MRCMPKNNLYVPKVGAMLARPWWCMSYGRWSRTDGASALQVDVAAFIDQEDPVAPPPLRAGQVWLLEARNVTTTALLDIVGWTKPVWTGVGASVRLGGKDLTRTEAESLLLHGTDPQWKAFLIFDPLDPRVAPWTGAKEDGWPDPRILT